MATALAVLVPGLILVASPAQAYVLCQSTTAKTLSSSWEPYSQRFGGKTYTLNRTVAEGKVDSRNTNHFCGALRAGATGTVETGGSVATLRAILFSETSATLATNSTTVNPGGTATVYTGWYGVQCGYANSNLAVPPFGTLITGAALVCGPAG